MKNSEEVYEEQVVAGGTCLISSYLQGTGTGDDDGNSKGFIGQALWDIPIYSRKYLRISRKISMIFSIQICDCT